MRGNVASNLIVIIDSDVKRHKQCTEGDTMQTLPAPRLQLLDESERYRIILKEDLANVLLALMTSETRHSDYYKALIRVAMAFGINVDTVPEPEPWKVEDNVQAGKSLPAHGHS